MLIPRRFAFSTVAASTVRVNLLFRSDISLRRSRNAIHTYILISIARMTDTAIRVKPTWVHRPVCRTHLSATALYLGPSDGAREGSCKHQGKRRLPTSKGVRG